MGRRAKKAPVVTKRKPKLSKRFKCPFCANEDVVECNMDYKIGVGSLQCRLCGASYQMNIHHLNEPIDVFSEWLDDCEAAAATGNSNNAGGAATSGGHDDDDDDNDDVPDASGLSNQQKQRSTNKQSSSKNSSSKNDRNNPSIDLGVGDSEDDDDDDE